MNEFRFRKDLLRSFWLSQPGQLMNGIRKAGNPYRKLLPDVALPGRRRSHR